MSLEDKEPVELGNRSKRPLWDEDGWKIQGGIGGNEK